MLLTGTIRDSFQEFENEHSLVLFCYNCNYMCKECHNYNTVTNSTNIIGDGKTIINNSLNVLHSAVVFLGGEPTIYDNLHDLCLYVKKNKNKKTKIYTNGSNFELIKKIVDDNLLDAISIDLKCIRNVSTIIGHKITDEQYLENINKLIDFLRDKRHISVDLRTTKWSNIQDQLEDITEYVEKLKLPDNFKHIFQRKI